MVFAGACVLLLVFWTLLCELWTVWVHLALHLPFTESFFPWLSRQWLMEGIAIFACLAAIGALVALKFKPRALRISWWPAWWLWILWSGVSVFYSIDRGASLRSWLAFTSYGLLAYVMDALIETSDDLLLWVKFLVGAAIVVSLQGMYQYYGTFTGSLTLMEHLQHTGAIGPLGWGGEVIKDFFIRKRIFSVFGWPNLFAGFLLLVIPLSVSLAIQARTRLGCIGWAGASGLLTLCLILTLSMGAWIAAVLTGCLAWWLIRRPATKIPRPSHRSPRSLAWLVVIGVVVCGVIGVTSFIVAKRARPFILGSTSSRLVYLQGAWNIIRAHPLLGTGMGTFGIAYRSLMPLESSEGQHAALHAHNTLLQVGVELGLVGLALFVLFLWRMWQLMIVLMRSRASGTLAPIHRGLTVGVLGFFIHSVFEQTFFEAATAPFWWMGVGMLAGAASLVKGAQRSASREQGRLVSWQLSAIICWSLLITLRVTMADVWATQGMSLDLSHRSSESLLAFERAKRWDPFQARYPLEMGERVLQHVQQQSPETNQVLLRSAQQQLERASTLSPWLGYVWMRLGMVRWQLGAHDQALEAMQRAVARDPNLRSAQAQLMQMDLALGRYVDAQTAAQRFEHLEPVSPFGYFMDALASEKLGQRERAIAEYQDVVHHDPTHYAAWFNLAELLRAQEGIEKAGRAYEMFLRSAPQHDQLRRDRARNFLKAHPSS